MQNQAALPDECVLMCSFAQSKLEEMWGQMLEAKIGVSELENVAQHQQNMENLCFAVGIGIKEPRQKQRWSSEIVHPIMQQRITELTAVQSYRKKLKYLCSLLPHTAGTHVHVHVHVSTCTDPNTYFNAAVTNNESWCSCHFLHLITIHS